MLLWRVLSNYILFYELEEILDAIYMPWDTHPVLSMCLCTVLYAVLMMLLPLTEWN